MLLAMKGAGGVAPAGTVSAAQEAPRPNRYFFRVGAPGQAFARETVTGRTSMRALRRPIGPGSAPLRHQGFSVIVPFISAECPGKLQKKENGPSPASLATGIFTDVASPPPMTLLAAITRASPGLR